MQIKSVRLVYLLLGLIGSFLIGLLSASHAAEVAYTFRRVKQQATIAAVRLSGSVKTATLSRAAETAAATKRKAVDARRRAAGTRRKAEDARRRAHAAREAAFRARVSRYGLSWPRADIITSPFGPRRSGFHHGIDILCGPKGLDPIYSAAGGRVLVANILPIYGRAVIVQHSNQIKTLYAHLSSSWVRPGQTIRRGQGLGRCGNTGNSTGPHLHFEVRNPKDQIINPLVALPRR